MKYSSNWNEDFFFFFTDISIKEYLLLLNLVTEYSVQIMAAETILIEIRDGGALFVICDTHLHECL